jgi:hypothetical protein
MSQPHPQTGTTRMNKAQSTRPLTVRFTLACLVVAWVSGVWGCGEEPGPTGDVTPAPCGGACPAELCRFNVCVEPEGDMADMAVDAPGEDGEDAPDMIEDSPDAADAGCQGDGDCAEGEVCQDGACVRGEEPACVEDGDCEAGQICELVDGAAACVEGCREDGDCPGTMTCVEGACAGGDCAQDTDCEAGQYCEEESATCFGGCRDDADCDPGESCLQVGLPDGPRQRCVETPCARDTDCDPGFYCDVEGGACSPGCRGDQECEGFEICDLEARDCVAPGCARSDECELGFYCDQLLTTPSCAPGCNDDARCPEGRTCDQARLACTCARDRDCVGGQVCSLGICAVRCEVNEDCVSGQTCDVDTGRCVDACVDDDQEPNNSPDMALPIEPGDYDLRMCYRGVGQAASDCFSLTLVSGEVLRVTAMFDHALGNLDMRLFDVDGDLVGLSQTNSDLEELLYRVGANGTYTFCADPAGDGFASVYSLSVGIEDAPLLCLEDAFEAIGDNTCPAARQSLTPLALGQTNQYRGRTLCEGDDDYIAVRMQRGQELYASLTRLGGLATLDVELVGGDCDQILAQSSTFGPIRDLEYVADADGDFFLHVYGLNELEWGEYELSARLEAGQFQCGTDFQQGIPLEPNQSPAEASVVPVVEGVTATVADLYLCQDDVDFYSVFVNQAQDSLRVTLSQSLGDESLEVAVLARDGRTVLVSNRDQLGEKVVETAPLAETGNYYVRVSAANPVSVAGVNYDLRFERFGAEVCVDDAGEPNNAPGAATLIGDGPNAATMCRADAGELDYYALQLGSGDRVEITLEYDHAQISPLLSELPTILYGPGGALDFRDLMIRDGFTDFDRLVLNAFTVGPQDAGTWLLEVGAGGVGLNVEYVVNVSIVSPECQAPENQDFFEPNEACGQAYRLASGAETTGIICGPSGDQDFFQIEAELGESFVVDMEYFHFDGNLDLELYQGSALVATSYNDGPNFEQIRAENLTGEPYCLRVFGTSGLTQNNYSLEISVDP